MMFSFACDLRPELGQALPNHPVERRKRMGDVGESRQRVPSLIAITSSPTISPARGVTIVPPINGAVAIAD
jgi:hypothetical protein